MKNSKFKALFLLFFVCSSAYIHSQSTQFGIGGAGHLAGPGGVAVRYLGWNAATNIPLEIRHDRFNQTIDFYTGGSAAAFFRMRINSNVGPTAGFVGINQINPAQRLTVAGDINLETILTSKTTTNDGYRINNFTVLSVKNSDNLFVGMNAGNNWVSSGVVENTFLGNRCGFNTTTGAHNLFAGFEAGFNHTMDKNNLFGLHRAGLHA